MKVYICYEGYVEDGIVRVVDSWEKAEHWTDLNPKLHWYEEWEVE